MRQFRHLHIFRKNVYYEWLCNKKNYRRLCIEWNVKVKIFALFYFALKKLWIHEKNTEFCCRPWLFESVLDKNSESELKEIFTRYLIYWKTLLFVSFVFWTPIHTKMIYSENRSDFRTLWKIFIKLLTSRRTCNLIPKSNNSFHLLRES